LYNIMVVQASVLLCFSSLTRTRSHTYKHCRELGKTRDKNAKISKLNGILFRIQKLQYSLWFLHSYLLVYRNENNRAVKRLDKTDHAVSFCEELTAFICWRCNAANSPCQVSPGALAT
jgi:hypothetical protein